LAVTISPDALGHIHDRSPVVVPPGEARERWLDTTLTENPVNFARPPLSEPPSGLRTRPFALRWLVEIGIPTPSESYRYCPLRTPNSTTIT
jgi:hypothetical protein